MRIIKHMYNLNVQSTQIWNNISCVMLVYQERIFIDELKIYST